MNVESNQRAERHRLAKEIFLGSCELDVKNLGEYLNKQCGEDSDLRAEVERLIANDREPLAFVGGDARAVEGLFGGGFTQDERSLPLTNHHKESVDGYDLVRQIGEGGFGEVWYAEQKEPVRRTVALKLLKLGMDSREVLARFEFERQTLARMEHPHIAKVYDAGLTQSGRSFFAMEYLPGTPILEYCDGKRLTLEERLRLIAEVCHAVQHAHQKGVIHRDLKPSNILVAEIDGRHTPKIIDFGIAKAIGDETLSHTLMSTAGALIGTPEYMSPEQAERSGADVDARSDIYSLGVLLYELLTGTSPFESLRERPLEEMLKVIRQEEPKRPSTRINSSHDRGAEIARSRRIEFGVLAKALRHDLDWVVMKALEKEPARRYVSAAAIADEIYRYLKGEPLVARPPSFSYRTRKFVDRHRTALVVSALIVLLFVGGLIGTIIGFVRASDAAQRASDAAILAKSEADRAKREAQTVREINDFLNEDLLAAVSPDAQGIEVSMREVLDVASRRIEGRFANQPEIEASLRHTLGRTYSKLGEFERSRFHLERARDLWLDLVGRDDGRTLDALDELAFVSIASADYTQAEGVYQDTWSRRRALFGDAHSSTLGSMCGLAASYAEQGRLKESLDLFNDCLELSKSGLGEAHPQSLHAMRGIAMVQFDQGRADLAEQTLVQCVEFSKETLGEGHPDTLLRMGELAAAYRKQEKLEEAQEIFEEALARSEVVRGEDHPGTLVLALNLALVSFNLAEPGTEEVEDAISLLEEVVGSVKKVFPRGHPNVISAMLNLARVLERANDLDRSEDAWLELHALSLETRGESDSQTRSMRESVADFYRRRGLLEKAREFSR